MKKRPSHRRSLFVVTGLAGALAACTTPAATKPAANGPGNSATRPVAAPVSPVADPHLIHRYSFTGNANDLAGKVNGELKGGAKITNGQLVLDNGATLGSDPSISYLAFASSVLPKTDSASIVFWYTGNNTAPFSKVFDIGDREGAEGRAFIYFTPANNNGSARAAMTADTTATRIYVDFTRIDDGKAHAVALVVDGMGKKLHVFLDGKETGTAVDLGAITLDKVRPVNNWLGRSLFDHDPGLSGSIDEFRVYDVALTGSQAAAIAAAGPDKLP